MEDLFSNDTGYHAIVPELVGSDRDGHRIVVNRTRPVLACRLDDAGEPTFSELVPTGSVRWYGDVPVEVWVPEDRLGEWVETE